MNFILEQAAKGIATLAITVAMTICSAHGKEAPKQQALNNFLKLPVDEQWKLIESGRYGIVCKGAIRMGQALAVNMKNIDDYKASGAPERKCPVFSLATTDRAP